MERKNKIFPFKYSSTYYRRIKRRERRFQIFPTEASVLDDTVARPLNCHLLPMNTNESEPVTNLKTSKENQVNSGNLTSTSAPLPLPSFEKSSGGAIDSDDEDDQNVIDLDLKEKKLNFAEELRAMVSSKSNNSHFIYKQ